MLRSFKVLRYPQKFWSGPERSYEVLRSLERSSEVFKGKVLRDHKTLERSKEGLKVFLRTSLHCFKMSLEIFDGPKRSKGVHRGP